MAESESFRDRSREEQERILAEQVRLIDEARVAGRDPMSDPELIAKMARLMVGEDDAARFEETFTALRDGATITSEDEVTGVDVPLQIKGQDAKGQN